MKSGEGPKQLPMEKASTEPLPKRTQVEGMPANFKGEDMLY